MLISTNVEAVRDGEQSTPKKCANRDFNLKNAANMTKLTNMTNMNFDRGMLRRVQQFR